jgi:hypothetical protein
MRAPPPVREALDRLDARGGDTSEHSSVPWPSRLTACGLCGLALLGALGALQASAVSKGVTRPRTPVTFRTAVEARNSRCDQPQASPLAYRWPIRPFERQHPIRGFFGDPRTVTAATLGEDSPGSVGSFNFHNGVDISAPTGTRVYPVVSGVVRTAGGDKVVVDTGDFRTFQYYHLRPAVRTAQRVVAYRTVLGTVRPEWEHVHLTEIDGFRVHNPADPGHLEPYHDHTIPSVVGILFRTEQGRDLDPFALHGVITIAADARDAPPIPVPGAWFDFPVTPAVVKWRMASRGSVVVPETTVADFRLTEPPDRDFWHVYAAGTYQNFPVFHHHYYFRFPGRYLFNLTPTALDTTRLPDGLYGVTVDVADVCGNLASFTERVAIRNRSRGS